MNREQQHEWIAALLRTESTLSLATVDEAGLPSIAPLFYLMDDDLTLYWLSSYNSQHSRNLMREPRVSATVYRSVLDWKEICGVQMRGRVSAVIGVERRRPIVERYCQRFQLSRFLYFAIRNSTLWAFQPEWVRGIDNSKRFGWKFEMQIPGR
jgi:uncharacterized protein YhbP (UPF0306 family)